jgi:hypothetical protein
VAEGPALCLLCLCFWFFGVTGSGTIIGTIACCGACLCGQCPGFEAVTGMVRFRACHKALSPALLVIFGEVLLDCMARFWKCVRIALMHLVLSSWLICGCCCPHRLEQCVDDVKGSAKFTDCGVLCLRYEV